MSLTKQSLLVCDTVQSGIFLIGVSQEKATCFFRLKMESVRSSETTIGYIPEDNILHAPFTCQLRDTNHGIYRKV
jgi:hypothetical protein